MPMSTLKNIHSAEDQALFLEYALNRYTLA